MNARKCRKAGCKYLGSEYEGTLFKYLPYCDFYGEFTIYLGPECNLMGISWDSIG